MNHFDQFIEYRLLDFKYRHQNSAARILDTLSDSGELPIPTKNVCALLSADLVQRFEEQLKFLGMSKREFFEMVILDSFQRVEEMKNKVDPFEFHRELEEKESNS